MICLRPKSEVEEPGLKLASLSPELHPQHQASLSPRLKAQHQVPRRKILSKAVSHGVDLLHPPILTLLVSTGQGRQCDQEMKF